MLKVTEKRHTDDYVYDISLDGTVVNALGMNVMSNTDGFNFQLPDEDRFRYTKENPYIGKGLNRNVDKGKEYTGFEADVAEFNDLFMRKFMGLGIDEVVDATINFSRKNYADYFPDNNYPEDVKKVGNTIKSKKMPGYISKFLDKGIRLLFDMEMTRYLDGVPVEIIKRENTGDVKYRIDPSGKEIPVEIVKKKKEGYERYSIDSEGKETFIEKSGPLRFPIPDDSMKDRDIVKYRFTKNGKKFLDYYYSYIEKIYNYQIPIKDIASRGKIKKSVEDYKADCLTVTKAGTSKARQAWMEIAIKENLRVNMGDVIYYYNTGTKKKQSDVKKIKHYLVPEGNGWKEITKDLEREWNKYNKERPDKKTVKAGVAKKAWMEEKYPGVREDIEIELSCTMIPPEMVESEDDLLCEKGKEYNVAAYIDKFNSRLARIISCFDRDMRDKILIDNPKDRPYFTEKETVLTSGQPLKVTDQDTYLKLMTMEDKEIVFWMNNPQFEVPFIKECGMDWEEIKREYIERKKREKELGIDNVRTLYSKAIAEMTSEDRSKLMNEGDIPDSISRIVDIDPVTGNFVCKEYPDIVIGSVSDLISEDEDDDGDMSEESDIE